MDLVRQIVPEPFAVSAVSAERGANGANGANGTGWVRRCYTPFRRMKHLTNEQAEAVIAKELARPQWSPSQWRDYFEERAAIAQHDGGQDRLGAEHAAYLHCIRRWLERHPPGYRSDLRCLHCGGMIIRADSLPVICGDNLQRWLHRECESDFRLLRVHDARFCLDNLGIVDPACAHALAVAVADWLANTLSGLQPGDAGSQRAA